ncbi:zinc finger C3H1 domain-containing protein isoform X2 [Scleropages formosus]|uniref:Zinc finger C3H1-type containing n=1 Tax=Scleropages formosus TaxID=113540 RepID=A0A8C9S1W0_SCLFO|nr:zinc finger C3H1 domain-containing protein isoform X2 [Scleropages formosus]
MELNSSGQSPREEGELEDGEICDDDTDEKQFPPRSARPGGACGAHLTRSGRKNRPAPQARPPPPGAAPLLQDLRAKMPFNRPPHPLPPPPFLPGHRLLCGGPSAPERPLPGQHGEPGARSSFWERSHGALGRLRHRGRPSRGRGDWNRPFCRGDGPGTRPPPGGRFEFTENPGNRKESPVRKQKPFGRAQVRKSAYNVAKTENGVDESFEDLLMKYKQIQLELECIRKEEKMALKPKEDSHQEVESAISVIAGPVSEDDSIQVEVTSTATTAATDQTCPEKAKKVFQAFNLKPLRQKLLTPAERDKMNRKAVKESEKIDSEGLETPEPAATEEEEKNDEEKMDGITDNMSCADDKDTSGLPVKAQGKEEDEELSELQLRLLALQSASKKWQQKEQQVMKESKERLTKVKTPAQERANSASKHSTQEKGKVTRALPEKGKATTKAHQGRKNINPGSAAKQAWRKQQLRSWKLQQQKEQQQEEQQRRLEEEERRKREEEIRRIRDLSNQDEQYNRFMKLVGGRRHLRTKSLDAEYRKSLSRQGLDTSGNLYQYDNYDEVAMDTDSETNSPASSPTHEPFSTESPTFYLHIPAFPVDSPPHHMGLQDLDHRYLDPVTLATSTSLSPMPPPPLPPDEPEQPPKPPFADEEEEEEMLLREELLKSLASKRAVKSEETSSSGPPSPIVQVMTRSNLATMTQPRPASAKLARGHPAARPVLVLPRHKSVVVQLNGSDDSDSEGDLPDATQMVFGGLESMIKEARRTAEAAKPKGTSGSEKENNPVRTPDSLSDAKKMEYRRLKEEIASREKQRVLNSDPSKTVPSPASSDVESDPVGRAAELQLTEAESRMSKHKSLLLKDEALLKHLVQQELKKREFLKAAEAKVARLKEQLVASEKIVGANKVLLKKLQEQIHRVQHRVTVKKHQAQKLERDLAQAWVAAGRMGAKRKSEASFLVPNKLLRLDGSPRSEQHFAELIAQKQRLQQLESEYALKIKKLKEAQALRNREVQAELQVVAAMPQSLPPSPFPLPQPSLHDLTQDKLTLASDDPEPEDETLSSCPTTGRRRSFRESGSFTKPKLRHLDTTPCKAVEDKAMVSKDGNAKLELFLGLNVGDLQQKYQESSRLAELMEMGPSTLGYTQWTPIHIKELPQDLDLNAMQKCHAELKPVPFEPYHSPLLVFRSYRFSPFFRTKEKLSLSSVSYSHAIEPRKCFCRFDLTGTCNDDGCRWQHMRNCSLKGNQLFQDILSYNLPLIGCSENTSSEKISIATEKYINKLFGANKDRMGTDQKAVLLVSKVNESLGHVPPHTTCKERRKWRPQPMATPESETEKDSSDEDAGPVKYEPSGESCWSSSPTLDACITQDDDRYFTGETDDISNLETSVLESPKDVQLWIKLAYKYHSQKESSPSECLDAALNTLSRALEDNRDNPEVWCHYLTLFAKRGKREEVQEMCEMAVEYAPDYQVWWTYLNIESSFNGKDYVCGRMVQYLQQSAVDSCSELLSFQLLESLLYRVQLSLFSGRRQNALVILQNVLKSSSEEKSLAEKLSSSDCTLAWLSYIHLTEFGSLPASLYDPADSNPSHIVCKDPFLLPWSSPQAVKTPPDVLVALFEDAIEQCTDKSLPPAEQMLACLPLHTNLVAFHQLMGSVQPAVALCEALLVSCPSCCPLLEALAEIHMKAGKPGRAHDVWLAALSKSPHNAEVFYHTCKFLMSQEKSHTIAPLFQEFVMSFCEAVPSEQHPVNVLRFILGIPDQNMLRAPSIKKELQNELVNQMPYMCLLYCLWQSLHTSIGEAIDAFERALGTVMQEDVVQRLWMDYLLFTSSKFLGPQSRNRDLKVFRDLVHRCLATAPTRITVPFSSANYWSNFKFHNKVISFYLSCLPQSQHSLVLEGLRYLMPTNTELALRFLQHEWRDGNLEHLKLQTRMLSGCIPNCLAIWKIAIAVQRELKGHVEVRRLYRQALQKLPLCATLWKDRLLFEAAEGGKTDKLRKLVDKCQEVGVRLDESLNLGSDRTQEKDH